MRVLFYAANPESEHTLRLEHEITELQRASFNVTRRIDFVFLPALAFEDIGEQISIYRPDVVHISAHGVGEKILLADTGENKVILTAEALNALLATHPPKLLYLNACSSMQIAQAMKETVSFAIGTSAPITNFAARKGAVNFYRCIMQGLSLAAAHAASKNTIRVLSDQGVETDIAAKTGFDASRQYLYERTRIVSCFEKHTFIAGKDGFSLEFGIAGSPNGTHQVVFCSDDPSFIGKNHDDLETRLCSVQRSVPSKGEIWLDEIWNQIDGDFKIYCFGMSAVGEPFAIGCMARDALEEFYKVYYQTDDGSSFPTALKEALASLRENDGSRVRPNRLSKARTTTKE